MKTLTKTLAMLTTAGRWDIDFHLPAELIEAFPKELRKRVDEVADLAKEKRDPTKAPESVFRYVDISSVDVIVGAVQNPQELDGEEAPSRARKVVAAYDVIVSTCRPTRGAIAVVPSDLHDQIVSTAFSVWRSHDDVNPYYLLYALRLPSTLEQFRKWSTGSSYPAILDEDVAKTIIPVPDTNTQDRIAALLIQGLAERDKAMSTANREWQSLLNRVTADLLGQPTKSDSAAQQSSTSAPTVTAEEISDIRRSLPKLTSDNGAEDPDEVQDDEPRPKRRGRRAAAAKSES